MKISELVSDPNGPNQEPERLFIRVDDELFTLADSIPLPPLNAMMEGFGIFYYQGQLYYSVADIQFHLCRTIQKKNIYYECVPQIDAVPLELEELMALALYTYKQYETDPSLNPELQDLTPEE